MFNDPDKFADKQQDSTANTRGYVQELIELHAGLKGMNPYCYFELAYTRQTEWMAWICTNAVEADPNRKVMAKGQGSTPELAAKMALESFNRVSHLSASAIAGGKYEFVPCKPHGAS